MFGKKTSELERVLNRAPADWTEKEAGYVLTSAVGAIFGSLQTEGWTSETGAMACAALATTCRLVLPAMPNESTFMPWAEVKGALLAYGKPRGW